MTKTHYEKIMRRNRMLRMDSNKILNLLPLRYIAMSRFWYTSSEFIYSKQLSTIDMFCTYFIRNIWKTSDFQKCSNSVIVSNRLIERSGELCCAGIGERQVEKLMLKHLCLPWWSILDSRFVINRKKTIQITFPFLSQ